MTGRRPGPQVFLQLSEMIKLRVSNLSHHVYDGDTSWGYSYPLQPVDQPGTF